MTCFRQMEYSKDDKNSFWYWIIKIVWLYLPPPHLHSSLPPPSPSFFPPSLTLFLSLWVSLSLSLFLSLHYEKVYMSRHSYQSAENWDLLGVRLENRPSILSQGMRWPVLLASLLLLLFWPHCVVSSLARNWTHNFQSKSGSPNHWTAREFPFLASWLQPYERPRTSHPAKPRPVFWPDKTIR